MGEPLLVLTNLPDAQSAQAIARAVVEQKLAACVNMLPAVRSIYSWQGRIEEAEEICLLIKSTQARFGALQTAIIAMHPYEVPEIIALPITDGLPRYLDWIEQETKRDDHV